MKTQTESTSVADRFYASARQLRNAVTACGARRWLQRGVAGLLMVPGLALAAITPTSINMPGDIGMGMPAQIQVNWTRSAAGAGDYFTMVLPVEIDLAASPLPAGCTYDAGPRTVTCIVPDGGVGASGSVTLDVVGAATGASNVTAVGNSGNSAAKSFTVQNSGDLTVGKVKSSPVGDAVAGGVVSFVLTPKIAVGGNNVPAGSSIVVIDQLPGTAAQFTLTARSFSGPLTPSCNTVGSANTSRTLTCTYSGAFTIAQLNASSITVTGTQNANGTFTNIASVASGDATYLDRVTNNNQTQVNYTAQPGTDLRAQGTFPASYQETGASQNLVLTYQNGGPLQAAAGGTVQTIIPAGFGLGALPAGCTNDGAGTLSGISGTLITCTAGVVNNGSSQSFTLPLTMPSAQTAGNFPVVVTAPAGMTDSNLGNNSILLPYQVRDAFADLRLNKSKSPGSGPIAAGTPITTTLTVTNDGGSLSAATYDATHPLRVVDDVRPEEISGGTLAGVTAGWACSVNPGAGITPRTTRVECYTTGAGSLAIGASMAVSFQTTVAAITGQITLENQACTGATALARLSLAATDGPQPADPFTANDCDSAGGQLVATDVDSGNAAVNIVKESTVDGSTWFDPVASAPTLVQADNDMSWRITITTPSGGSQATIPALNLTDTLPGILNATGSPGNPAHNFVTPAVTVTVTGSGYASHNCPATIAAGSANLNCAFTNVAPNANIVVRFDVQRPLASGLQANKATLTSPNAILSWDPATGKVGSDFSDEAAVNVAARHDLAMTSKTVTPLTPKVGEIVTFTLGAQNIGQGSVPIGDFTIVDDLFTGVPTLTGIAYDFVGASGTDMNCTTSAQPGDITRISCVNTTAVSRWNVRTITIQARIKKPAGSLGAANSTLYSGVTNSARVNLGGGLCEYRLETFTAPVQTSSSCNDLASISNNTKNVTFDVKVPAIDLQQNKTAIYPGGQTSFRLGDTLRYRFSVRNFGPSRAEEIVMTDILDPIPAGFTFTLNGSGAAAVVATNTGSADAGYSFVSRAISCTQASANANVVCQLNPTLADSWLDAMTMVNFDLTFTMTGTATGPVVFGDRAYVCADETNTYESSGKCTSDPALAGNNLAALNETIFPPADLSVIKTTQTAGPVNVGQPVEYRVVLTNNGTATVEKMRLVDQLPSAFEWMTTGAQQPTATPAGGATLSGVLAVSASVPANGTDNVCFISAGPATVTAPAQQQTITCDVGGNFPANGQVIVTLWARPKSVVYDGSANAPFLTDRTNNAQVQPGRDSGGGEVSVDNNPANNTASSQVQVQNSSLAGRVFHDRNDNGDQDGTGPTDDHGLAGVTITLTGTDAYGNPVSATTTTNASGDYVFNGLPPSDAAGYTIVETQPAGYDNGQPQPNTPRPNRNGTSTGVAPVAGGYAVSNAAGTSTIGGIVLAGGAVGVQFDFPETHLYSLSGFVFADRVRDDVYAPGGPGADTPIPGATVELLVWDAGAGAYVPAAGGTTTTAADGSYSFANLSPANVYAVRELLPAGYLNLSSAIKPGLINGVACAACVTQTDAATNVDMITGIQLTGNATNFNFGETVPVSVAGTVFFDTDNEGTQNNAADVGISGVTMVLTGTDDLGNPVNVSTVTGADGSFSFTGLRPGTYTVTEPTQPTGTQNGITTAGTVAGASSGTATPITTTPSAVTTIDLTTPGSASINNLFGEIPLGSSIVGKIWLDANDNGVIEPGENGIGGVVVELTGTDIASNPVTRTTTTLADGSYSFTNLPPGNYTVTEPSQPVGTRNGETLAGSTGGTATPKATTPSAITSIPLAANQHSINNNFGEIPQNSSISGRVWLDLDNDGVIDPGEEGIAGVTVRLTGIDAMSNPVFIEVVTDAQGRYSFDGLSPGTYAVTEPTQPTNTFNGETVPGSLGGTGTPVSEPVSSISSIVLGADQHAQDNNFGEIQKASIAGRVYNDSNDDGQVDPGEVGIPGVEIVLTGTDDLGNPVHLTTTTDADGNYHFDNLRPGTYKVTEPTQPANTANGETTPGSNGGTATPKTTTPSAIDGIVLKPGDTSINNNFGEIGDSPDMLVSKSVVPATPVTGNPATYTIVVRNGGQRPSNGEYVVEDRLPEGFVLTGAPTGQGWVCTGAAGDVRFSCRSSAVLAAGETSAATITVPVRVGNSAGTVHNAVLIEGGGEYDFRKPTPEERDAFENNVPNLPVCDSAVVHNACQLPSEVVLAWPNVVVSKSTDSPVFTVGLPANYLIRVRNIGERATDAAYTVEDRLPTGIVLAGTPSGDGWNCTGVRGGSTFQCSSDRVLAADATHPGTIKVPVDVRPEAVGHGAVNNAVLVAGGGEPSDRGPTTDERTDFEQHPDALDECDQAISQNACRVPNDVQMPTEPTVLRIAKRGDRSVVEIGDSLVYTIDIRHVSGAGLYQVDVIDRLPRGFTYIEGTARVDGAAIPDPQGKPGPTLVFAVGALPTQGQKVLTYRVRVGVGAAQGDGINRAQAHGCQAETCVNPDTYTPVPGSSPSNPTEYRVTVTGGVFTDEGCVVGKIFMDCNLNHVQDKEELGIPGVRLYFEDGTWMVSDSEGKYSYCGLPPQSHTLKVDPSTLPTGARLTTSSNRNLGDADSLFIDLKNGELHRADFIEGSCSNLVIEQVKARRAQGEVRAPETETGKPQLRFESKPLRAPQQGTDSSNQRPIVEPRPLEGHGASDGLNDESKEVQP